MATTKAVTRSEFDNLKKTVEEDHKCLNGNGVPGIKVDLAVVKSRVDLILGLMVPILLLLIATAIDTFVKK